MPITATITSFYSFTPGVKALSAEVNTNFSNLKGHFIPIDPTISAASNVNYDLGSDEHRWLTSYLRDFNLTTSTTTASLIVSGDTSVTGGAFKFSINNVEKFRINSDGFSGINTSSKEFTSTASLNQFARSSSFNINTSATTTTLIPGSTITITTVGRPVRYGITTPYAGGNEDSSQFTALLSGSTSTFFGIQYNVHPNTLGTYYINSRLYRYSTLVEPITSTVYQIAHKKMNNLFNGILFLPAGTHTLCLSYQTSNIVSCFYFGRFYAYEV